MATSRTGTASHKRFRKRVLAQGQADGIVNCPCREGHRHHAGRPCGVKLDYSRGKLPNSAEPDHIVASANGGGDTVDNGRVICRRCNQSRGKGRSAPRADVKPVRASPIW